MKLLVKYCFQVLAFVILTINTVHGLDITILPTLHTNSRSGSILITLQYENKDQDTVLIKPMFFPEEVSFNQILNVTLNGEPVEYIGRVAKRVPDTVENCVPVEPGKTVSTTIDISADYNFDQTGVYTIGLNGDPNAVIFESDQSVARPKVNDHSVIVAVMSIEGREQVQAGESSNGQTKKRRGIGGYIRCSSTQISSIQSAFSVAQTYASGAYSYLNSIAPSATPRYTTWFGALTTTRWNLAKQHYYNIYQSFVYQAYTFDCTCTDSGTYAYVYPSQPYKVYFCGYYWQVPVSGTDSKGGTIVHEASHFTVLGGTQDYAYGQSAAKNLAKSSPDKAVMNADSHEYFAENTPALS